MLTVTQDGGSLETGAEVIQVALRKTPIGTMHKAHRNGKPLALRYPRLFPVPVKSSNQLISGAWAAVQLPAALHKQGATTL